MNSAFVHANGVRLHYLEHGGDGPVLVLLHGLSANAHSFDGLVKAGLARRLRVLAFDLRGRGLSDKPARGYAVADHAEDVLAALDRLDLERVILGGHSYGGFVTLQLAANEPDRVEKAVVLDTPTQIDARILEQIRPSLERLEREFPTWDAYLQAVKAMPYFEGWDWDEALEAFYRADVEELPGGRVRARCRPEHIEQAVAGTLEVDWPAVVSRIAQPTLLVRSTDPFGPPGSPPILPADQAERTVRLLRRGRLVECAGNHITFMFGDNARILAEQIASFVEETDGASVEKP